MGFLLNGITPEIFEVIWEGWQIGVSAEKPENRDAIRMAAKIERKLLAMSVDNPDVETELGCPGCGKRFKINDGEHLNFWRVSTRRKLSALLPVFLEDAQMSYLMKVMGALRPPQPRLLLFDELWDFLETIEKEWKGEEPTLRLKWDSQTE